MKPPPFEYHDPRTIDETLSMLSEYGSEAKILAGGQSLVPMLNFRLMRPERLIDINNVAELDFLHVHDHVMRIGALTRHATVEHSSEVAKHVPLLAEAIRFVGHVQIRNRGTVGGSVVHADPAAELPVALAALDARFHLRSRRGIRTVSPEAFFVTHLTTSLEPDELLTEIEVPSVPRTGFAFVEFARRHGDFALGGSAVLLGLTTDAICERVAIGLLGAAPTPVRATDAEQWLRGQPVTTQTAVEAARRAVAHADPAGDIHGSSEYRLGLVEVTVRHALLRAACRAKEGT
jgi:CO/xanthine dehydrogenase FAD-binding subunit